MVIFIFSNLADTFIQSKHTNPLLVNRLINNEINCWSLTYLLCFQVSAGTFRKGSQNYTNKAEVVLFKASVVLLSLLHIEYKLFVLLSQKGTLFS